MKLACVLLLFCLSVQGDPITSAALGSQLAGGIVTVTRFGGALNSATFVVDSVTGAVASAPGGAGSGAFSLTVSPGDTETATWTLVNTDSSPIFLNVITAVYIDLFPSGISLFDSGSLPSTLGSGAGVPGVTYVSGKGIGSSAEAVAWSDAANAGDIYLATTIIFSSGLTPGDSSVWMDDTDVISSVPEPSQAVAIAAGLLLIWLRAHRRR